LSPDNDSAAYGPLQAIWRRIAYVTVEQLLREEYAGYPHPLPDDASDVIAVSLRPAAKTYVLTAVAMIVSAGPGGITLPALIVCLDTAAVAKAAGIDASTSRRLAEAIRQQFPKIFGRPLVIALEGRRHEISLVQDRFLAQAVT